jgi:phosphohistidine phosphatase
MDLLLLRHAIAVDQATSDGSSDSERPLTREGEKKMRRIARAMGALDLRIDLILTSPLVRARQSAHIVAEQFGLEKSLESTSFLEPGQSLEKLVSLVQRRSKHAASIVLVGHEPALSTLISVLISGDASVSVALKKGGLCKLQADAFHYGRCASLQWLMTPRQLLQIE